MEINFSNGIKLIISQENIDKLNKYRQSRNDNESGGILLGKKELDNETYVVSDITVPSLHDRSTKTSFTRDKSSAQKQINEIWKNSNGIINYIGEWHTHAEKTPIPSITDKRLIHQIYKDKTNKFRCFFMIILGNTGTLFIGVVDSKYGGRFKCKEIIEVN